MPWTLTFALAAPMTSMGDLAVGERRPTADRPARSSILGLLAACLGIDRADEDGHRALAEGCAIAMAMRERGPLHLDYQTAQAPSRERGIRYRTRADELADPHRLNTVQTWREYWTDVLVLVAVVERPGARHRLADVAVALNRPQFTPYFGRKASPLSLPMAPQLAEVDNLVSALLGRIASGPELGPDRPLWHSSESGRHPTFLFLDPEDVPEPLPAGILHLRTEIRRDRVHSRRRWQFDLGEEAVLRQEPAA